MAAAALTIVAGNLMGPEEEVRIQGEMKFFMSNSPIIYHIFLLVQSTLEYSRHQAQHRPEI